MNKKMFFYLILFSFSSMALGAQRFDHGNSHEDLAQNDGFVPVQQSQNSFKPSAGLQLGDSIQATIKPATWKQWAYMNIPGASFLLNCDHMERARLVKKYQSKASVPFGLEYSDKRGGTHFNPLKLGTVNIVIPADLPKDFGADVVISATRSRGHNSSNIENHYYIPKNQAQNSIAAHTRFLEVTLEGKNITFYEGSREASPAQQLCFGWWDNSLSVTTERENQGHMSPHKNYFNTLKNNQYEAAKHMLAFLINHAGEVRLSIPNQSKNNKLYYAFSQENIKRIALQFWMRNTLFPRLAMLLLLITGGAYGYSRTK